MSNSAYLRQCGCFRKSWLLAAVTLLAGTGSAQAIPSPELIVGSFVSLSQLFALASAILGGGATYMTMRSRRNGLQALPQAMMAGAVGLFVLLVVSVGFNIYQYIEQKNEHQARIESTLLRPSRAPQGLPHDPDAKELNYTEQGKHPLRISTGEAAKLLEAKNKGETDEYIFLDVREAAEQAMGSLRGATVVRFPDLKKANLDFTNKKAILFCHNGDRSSETCEELQKMGIDCKFVIGGLEKWIVEGRDMTGMSARNLAELRAIGDYPNRNTLLDTAQVKALVEKEKAIFVDIRNPTDFAENRIPGAVNLSLRRMPTEVMNEHIAKLPKRPIILPCYDRRGCFFAEVLGSELHRAGHDVRGRYTLPWEYFVQRPRPPHVEAWIAENNKGIWAKGAATLAGVMSPVSRYTGVVLVILLLAAFSRLLVLPFSVKAERDQIRARAATDELEALKTRWKADPVGRTRAIRGFYKRHGITPVRNLLALAFLPVMAVALLAVQELASKAHVGFLWISDLAERDPLYILPLVFGVLITLYVDLAFVTKTKHRVIVWLTMLPLMVVTGALFGAGGDLYLIASAALLLIQRLWVSGRFAALAQAWRRWRLGDQIISLEDAERIAGLGNKAFRLAQIRKEGMPVPEGIVLTPDFLGEFSKLSAERRQAQLDHVWNVVGAEKVAVRSSAWAEDGEGHSFAGVFDSILNVDRAALESAIGKVMASFAADRAQSYGMDGGRGSVIVQRMIAAEYAGVLFTQAPDASGVALVELVPGTAERLVSGAVRPQAFRFGRVSGLPLQDTRPPFDLSPLLALGRQAETLFGGPQDVEWTFHGGSFYLVQSRHITRGMIEQGEDAVVQADLAHVFDLIRGAKPHETVFAKNELSEMLPRPTPLSLSLMNSLWSSGGSVDLAARALGASYQIGESSADYVVAIRGRLYVNKREEQARSLKIGAATARRLMRQAERIERDFRQVFLPGFLAEIRVAEAADFDKLSSDELFDAIERMCDKLVHDTHVEVDVINIAAQFYFNQAVRHLTKLGLDPSDLLGHIPETVEERSTNEVARAPQQQRHAVLMASFGHRAALDYELSEPRYRENPAALNELLTYRHADGQRNQRQTAADGTLARLGKATANVVQIARRFQCLKEDAKHHSLRELAVLRQVILALDRQLGLDGLLFYLQFDELLALREHPLAEMRDVAAARRSRANQLLEMKPLPATLTVHELEAISAGTPADATKGGNAIRGIRVSGTGIVSGRARVIAAADAECGAPIEDFEDGDIIVAAMIHPSWLPYFRRAGGFVSEVGGWLSHTAILAREYNVTMIVGTQNVAAIANRSLLRLNANGSIEMLDEKMTRAAAA
jgi:rifampicin phosphotransferase